MSVETDNLKAAKSLRAAAAALRRLPTVMAEFYANGGPGNSSPVVGDRYQGKGNSRFAPLSTDYALWKQGQSKKLNQEQQKVYGKGSKLIKVEHKARHQGVDVHGFAAGSLPILVLTGRLRAAVIGRGAQIQQTGDVAVITFSVPGYAKWLQSGTGRMPRRSPVDPNEADITKIREMALRWLSAQTGSGSKNTTFGAGTARIL